MASTVRDFVIESLKGFYERLPLKKVAVDGSVLTPDASGVVDLGMIGNSPWEPGDGENSAVLKDTSSYATGTGTVTHGDNVHAIGDYSYAEGLGSSEPLSFTISGAANATAYTTNIAHGLNTSNILEYNGIIARVTAINTTKKFTVDHTLSDVQLTNASGLNKLTGISYGAYSHVEGENAVAFGLSSHAEGSSTVASGKDSHAEGYGAAASGYGSHAEGYGTRASSDYSHAEGYGAKASAQCSHAEGWTTEASGSHSHAEGYTAKASGNYSHAEGSSATASGLSSHAEGQSTTASGINSHAEGLGGSSESLSFTISGAANATTYTTNVEHDLKVGDVLKYNTTIVKVSGFDTRTQFTVDKTLSITKLTNTSSVKRIRGISYSEYSHAEGENTTTSGYSSHAEGTVTTTSGDYSHAEGRYTYTSNAYEHAQGSYNMSHNYNTTFGDNGNTLNSIGVGVSDASRSNVIEVMQNGDVYVKGVGSYDGSNYVDASTLQEVINSGGGSADLVISITYADLKNLRDTSSLVPGMQYRIRDYQCTTVQTDTSTAGHQFDIIVTADSEIKLNENARAAHHDDDTYFAACKLEAWELKYCLDNDTDRFTWADTSNGKGVIYYMKDEWNNECPYDFKNILFVRKLNSSGKYSASGTAKSVYTFNAYTNSECNDNTVLAHLVETFSCYNNIIKECYDPSTNYSDKLILNNIVFLDYGGGSCYDNYFGGSCRNNTLGRRCCSNIIEGKAYDNIIGDLFANNHVYQEFSNNTMGTCQHNIIGPSVDHCTFGGITDSNIGSVVNHVTTGSANYDIKIGNNCDGFTMGSYFMHFSANGTVQDLLITGGSSYSDMVSNTYVIGPLKGTSPEDLLTIEFAKGVSYPQFACLDSSGNLKIFTPADLVQ